MTEPHKIASASVRQGIADLTKRRFTPAIDITMTTSTDNRDSYLSRMLHLAGSRLLIADFTNNNVKVMDMQTNSLVSQISVPGRPWDICHLPVDQVAVTMANKGIQFLKTRGQLAIGDPIKVDGDCRGIAYHEDTLIVSFYNGKLAVLNMNGHVIRQIERDGSGKELFNWPAYLVVVGEGSTAFIYVSDRRRYTISKLDIALNIIKTFQDPASKVLWHLGTIF
ncbi:uncharacterized protein LOC128240142 [Mya arenaria]|uniref:uncharacterized protein LOC128240142 n=1 Tax=Mya arenaria TaxID=6604 RepID=UPI0022E044B0|nr:uncharacterized protein LOC128240142 [Mya arenaria]